MIVGGEVTIHGEFPHMAAIGWRSNVGTTSFRCGGSLISERFVLTAAHCSEDKKKRPPTIVRLGEQNLIRNERSEIDVNIAEFISHESFNPSSIHYDIAVIKLAYKVNINKFIRPACLWQSSNGFGSEAIVSGWGNTIDFGNLPSVDLRKAKLNIIDNYTCKIILNAPHLLNGARTRVLDSQMCATVLTGGVDTCHGGKLKNF